MTSSRYLLARFAQAFGYFRRAQRMGDAASEMHLLREAEAQLGTAIWEKTESIEALSVEYWNLRKLTKERNEVRDRLAECQGKLDIAHEERSNLLNFSPEEDQVLLDERAALLANLEKLAEVRDQIVIDAREVRRSYVGLNMKLEVLTEENAAGHAKKNEMDEVKARLIDLKTKFSELKRQRIDIGQKIAEGDSKVDLVENKMKAMRQQRRQLASSAFEVIGEGNKNIAILRAESGVIDTRMRQLYAEIGRYVSRNTTLDPACADAAKSHHNLVEVMRALRRSIALNHRLAGTA